MNTKKFLLIVCLFVLPLASCGPKPLTDMELAEAARTTCGTLQTESATLDPLDLTSRAAAYKRAAEALSAINITEASAPQGMKLRSGIAGLADSFDKFDKAINEAIAKANLKGQVTLMIGEDGTVFAYAGSIFDIAKLEIDPTLLANLRANQTQVQEAAISLALEECVVAW
jgi:hypothetical protein